MSLLVRSRADAAGLSTAEGPVSSSPVLVRAKMEYQGSSVEDAEAFSPHELVRWWAEAQLRPGSFVAVRLLSHLCHMQQPIKRVVQVRGRKHGGCRGVFTPGARALVG